MGRLKFDLKNLAVVFLFITALYQTGTLWLENYSGHNFFYYISYFTNNMSQKNLDTSTLDAKAVAVGYGNNVFTVFYGKKQKDFKENADAVIKQAIEESTMEENVLVDINSIIDKRAIVYTMPCDSLVADYIKSMNINVFGENIHTYSFDTIIVIPSASTNEKSYVYFMDSENKTSVVFSGELSEGKKLYSLIDNVSINEANKFSYISTSQSGFNIFGKNIFLPQWTQGKLQYGAVVEKKVFNYENENDMLTKMEGFFGSYHGQAWNKEYSDEFVISDNDIVVKYSPDGMLEYYSYKAEGKEQVQSIYSAYNVCTKFLKKDENIGTEYYISNVQFKNNSIIFCFDYCVDEIPIILTDKNKNRKYAIEVVVKNNSVKNYKRYAADFSVSPDIEMTAEKDFLWAINDIAANVGKNGQFTDISDMVLGYVKNADETYGLKWYTVIDEKNYIIDTKDSQKEQNVDGLGES